MQDFCAKNGYVYLDYYSALANPKFGMQKDLTIDGVHPNAAGYQVMAPLAEKAISDALAPPQSSYKRSSDSNQSKFAREFHNAN